MQACYRGATYILEILLPGYLNGLLTITKANTNYEIEKSLHLYMEHLRAVHCIVFVFTVLIFDWYDTVQYQ